MFSIPSVSLNTYQNPRMNSVRCDPAPAYLEILSPGASPTTDYEDFLLALAQRLHMLKRGGIPDISRAAEWFVKWWREDGGLLSAMQAPVPDSPNPSGRRGWGFDLEWSVDQGVVEDEAAIQMKMEGVIDGHLKNMEAEESDVSSTQEKKRSKEEMMAKRATKNKARLAVRRAG